MFFRELCKNGKAGIYNHKNYRTNETFYTLLCFYCASKQKCATKPICQVGDVKFSHE